ncbi:MAG: hypothetical protein KC636_33490 [Myxococcales bacterium]|nr:hypothetical protein [Myxococcales bacterium]
MAMRHGLHVRCAALTLALASGCGGGDDGSTAGTATSTNASTAATTDASMTAGSTMASATAMTDATDATDATEPTTDASTTDATEPTTDASTSETTTEPTTDTDAAGCVLDRDCTDDEVCFAANAACPTCNLPVVTCVHDPQGDPQGGCGPDEVCHLTPTPCACDPWTLETSTECGPPCVEDSDCAPAYCVEGVCSVSPFAGCLPGSCSVGQECVDAPFEIGLCVIACDGRDIYRCPSCVQGLCADDPGVCVVPVG